MTVMSTVTSTPRKIVSVRRESTLLVLAIFVRRPYDLTPRMNSVRNPTDHDHDHEKCTEGK